MTTATDSGSPNDDRASVPLEWRAALDARLEPGETVLAWFSPDLDARLDYCESLVVVTDRRLLHGAPEVRGSAAAAGQRDEPGPRTWQSWTLAPKLALRAHDRVGSRFAGAGRQSGSTGHLALHHQPKHGRRPVDRSL